MCSLKMKYAGIFVQNMSRMWLFCKQVNVVSADVLVQTETSATIDAVKFMDANHI